MDFDDIVKRANKAVDDLRRELLARVGQSGFIGFSFSPDQIDENAKIPAYFHPATNEDYERPSEIEAVYNPSRDKPVTPSKSKKVKVVTEEDVEPLKSKPVTPSKSKKVKVVTEEDVEIPLKSKPVTPSESKKEVPNSPSKRQEPSPQKETRAPVKPVATNKTFWFGHSSLALYSLVDELSKDRYNSGIYYYSPQTMTSFMNVVYYQVPALPVRLPNIIYAESTQNENLGPYPQLAIAQAIQFGGTYPIPFFDAEKAKTQALSKLKTAIDNIKQEVSKMKGAQHVSDPQMVMLTAAIIQAKYAKAPIDDETLNSIEYLVTLAKVYKELISQEVTAAIRFVKEDGKPDFDVEEKMEKMDLVDKMYEVISDNSSNALKLIMNVYKYAKIARTHLTDMWNDETIKMDIRQAYVEDVLPYLTTAVNDLYNALETVSEPQWKPKDGQNYVPPNNRAQFPIVIGVDVVSIYDELDIKEPIVFGNSGSGKDTKVSTIACNPVHFEDLKKMVDELILTKNPKANIKLLKNEHVPQRIIL